MRGHYEGDLQNYRSPEAAEEWKAKDPLARLEKRCLESEALTRTDAEQLRQRFAEEVADAVAYAKQAPYPDPSELTTDVVERWY
jgi:pyruvate dehydrogenase E1 component alpha subunit